jgi:Flp pilus assembly protein TadG
MHATHRHKPGLLARLRFGSTPPRSEQGSATVFVVFLSIALLAAAGLVIDGGYALAQRRSAINHAEQAARLAADQLSEPGLRNGVVRIDNNRAHAAAEDYLRAAGTRGTVDVHLDTVTVTVTDTYQSTLLSIVGVDEIPVSASATASSVDVPPAG